MASSIVVDVDGVDQETKLKVAPVCRNGPLHIALTIETVLWLCIGIPNSQDFAQSLSILL